MSEKFFSGIPFSNLLYLVTIPIAAIGFIRNYQSTYHTFIYSMLTFFLYTLWPEKQGLRFLFPVLPFYLSFVLSGLEVLLKDKDTRAMREGWFRKSICFTPLLAIILCFGSISVNQAYDNLQVDNEISVGPFSETSERMFAFITDHTEETSTVIFRKPRVMRLMTNRKSIMITEIGQITRGDYLCLSLRKNSRNGQVSISEIQELEKQGLIRLAYENNKFTVYDLNHAK